MPEKIFCLLCKETLTSDQEKDLGTHFFCSAEFARKNVNNLFVPETNVKGTLSHFQVYNDAELVHSHNSFFALILFNSLVISLYVFLIFILA